MTVALVLAVASSLLYGVSDFLGGLQSRSLPELSVLAVSQASALVLLAVLVLALGGGPPPWPFLAGAVGAGLCEAVGVAALYRGLAVGSMSIVAPVAATAPAVPVVVSLALGQAPAPPHWQAAAYALWDSTLAVGVFLGLLVVLRRWADRAGTLWNELARSAFGVYVLHAPLVVGLTVLLAGVPLAPLLKLVVAITAALPLCFAVAGLVRRLPGVARVL